jgi:eukaryotic-like serine/threonine-protein kinase
MSHLPSSQRFGPYELREVLGRTRMATVYLAHKVSTGQLVALKVIAESNLEDTNSFKTRFDREIEIARSLIHKNIVPVYEYGHTDNGRAFFEMQFLKGGNLEKYVKTLHLALSEARQIFTQLARALS